MDSFEWTKIAGAVLAALLLMFGFKTIVEMRTEHVAATEPGYALPGGKEEAAPAKAASNKPAEPKAAEGKPAESKSETKSAEAKPESKDSGSAAPAKDAPKTGASAGGGVAAVMAALGKANADNGSAVFKKCAACHNAAKGKGKAVGPNLWGIVNRPKGSVEGMDYSEPMKAKGGNWTFEDLSSFVTNPKGYVPGTKMLFNGLSNPEEAADVIAYLATLADTPVPLPK